MLSDLFIEQPKLNFFSAAKLLDFEEKTWVPADVGEQLKAECIRRNDFSFFARVALFTALTAYQPKGWSEQHYLLAAHWVGMLGGEREAAIRSWDYLKGLNLAEGWQPVSIFDPVIERALKLGFSHVP